MRNIVTAAVQSKVCRTVTEALYQYDYGQILQITGVDLPTEYEVHFSNKPNDGSATTVLGNADGVPIPDIYLTTGKFVYAWLFLHAGPDDGETVHTIEIPVWKRPKAADSQPTPVQQDVITETIAALNSAVSSVEIIAADIPGTIDTALREAKESGEFDGISPEATVTKEGRETTIRITGANGTTTAKVYDGETPDVSGKLDAAEKGAANGVAELDSSGKVPVSQLPSYVDDVVEYDSIDVSAWDEWEPGETYRVGDRRKRTSYVSNEPQVTGYVCTADNSSTSIRTDEWRTAEVFPAAGETSKIYVALDTNTTYRWGGSEYVPIGSSLALGETSDTAYRGDRGKAAYDAAVINPDYEPTLNSTHLITSGGVYDALTGKTDKVQGGTNGHLVSLVNGNIADSGHAADDYAVFRYSMQTPANNGPVDLPITSEASVSWFAGHYFTDNARMIGYNASQWKYIKEVGVNISSRSGTQQTMTVSVTVIHGAPAGTLEVYIADTINKG